MTIDIKLYFNFRSPYCYLLSTRLKSFLTTYDINLLWRPLGGWDGRSKPERVVKKLPLVRQDVARWCARYGIPLLPPPKTTDPTKAGAASLYAERQGCLLRFIVELMKLEWAEGQDIGQDDALKIIAVRTGLDEKRLLDASLSTDNLTQLSDNAQEAESDGVIGVPTFVIENQIFWGNDRLDFVEEYLSLNGARR